MPGSPDHSAARLHPRVIEKIKTIGEVDPDLLATALRRAVYKILDRFQARGGCRFYRAHLDVVACTVCTREVPRILKTGDLVPCTHCGHGRLKQYSRTAWDDLGNLFQALLLAPPGVARRIVDDLPPQYVDLMELLPTGPYWKPLVEGMKRDADAAGSRVYKPKPAEPSRLRATKKIKKAKPSPPKRRKTGRERS